MIESFLPDAFEDMVGHFLGDMPALPLQASLPKWPVIQG